MSGDSAEVLARIRAIAERAQQAAAGAAIGDDPPPEPGQDADRAGEAARGPSTRTPRHWSEVERDDQESRAGGALVRTTLSLEAGELAARENACARLRKLLADGKWHGALELVEVAGLRYGGRLYELRRGLDGGPALDVEAEAREQGGRQAWRYRLAPPRGQTNFARDFDSFSAPGDARG